jgi:hypothetical protein
MNDNPGLAVAPCKTSPMTLKKTDLARQMELKIEGQRKKAAIPGRFASEANVVLDRKEQRKRDAAAGLVPFACKLPGPLMQQLREKADAHEGGINALVAELLSRGLQ